MIRRVTLLHAFLPSAERALNTVRTLWPGAAVTFLHALDPESLPPPPISAFTATRSGARERHSAWTPWAARRSCRRKPADLTLDRARADLIALGTASRTAAGRLLFGSVAQRVRGDSPVPVLTDRSALERR